VTDGGPRLPDFDARAAAYDRLRPTGEAWWGRFDALVRLGELRGRRVLDVGCGTGAVAAALSDRAAAKVWGVEQSVEMLEVARSRVPRGVGLKPGRAENLPFRDGWFDRVVFSLVIHLVDRRRALAEAARVLVPGGRVVVATFAHEHFERYWAARFFPTLIAVDMARFPGEGELLAELAASGFDDIRSEHLDAREIVDRGTALERLRGRHISTFDLLDEDEVVHGIEQAERELPETVEVELLQLIVTARRPDR
jgi:ubiquinone/menaquinone biosynthesis C-methylase UbiE